MQQTLTFLITTLLLVTCNLVFATQVRFNTSLGNFEATLFPEEAPLTVQYFLDYVATGDYVNTLVHRSIEDFVIQGGGFYPNAAPVPLLGTVPLEINRSHLRGTLAMARRTFNNTTTTDSSQWFINLSDNSQIIDDQGGGFTIIGEISISGMEVVDSIAAIPVVNASTILDSSFTDLPVLDSSLQLPEIIDPSNLVVIHSITVVPEPTAMGLWAILALVVARPFRQT